MLIFVVNNLIDTKVEDAMAATPAKAKSHARKSEDSPATVVSASPLNHSSSFWRKALLRPILILIGWRLLGLVVSCTMRSRSLSGTNSKTTTGKFFLCCRLRFRGLPCGTLTANGTCRSSGSLLMISCFCRGSRTWSLTNEGCHS